MRRPNALRAQRLCRIVLLVVTPTAGCSVSLDVFNTDGAINNTISSIGITLQGGGAIPEGVLTLGDRDTVRAEAYTSGWFSGVKYDSQVEPRKFTYSSSNVGVASIDLDGVVVTLGIGTTTLRAGSEGVVSQPLVLTVVPSAAALRAAPLTLNAAVGDTVAIAITAVDSNAQGVAGIIFSVAPDTTYWAVASEPAEGNWGLGTPRVLHLRASRVGSIHVVAYSQNEHPSGQFQSPAVLITVHAP
jgi:hypothetical protein